MDPRRVNLISLAGILVLAVIGAVLLWPPQTKIKQGLDIQGGLSVILTAKKANTDSESMDRALLVMQNRVNALGVSEATVQREGASSILVQLPGVKDAKAALDVIGSTGQLEFVDWNSIPTTEAAAWDDYMTAVDSGREATLPAPLKEGSYVVLLDGSVITNAAAQADPQSVGDYAVTMTFNSQGTQKWATITTEYAATGRRVAIVLDGQVQSAPSIREPITGGQSQITGNFTAEQAKRLATVLQSGALPVDLEFSDTQAVGPTLGQESLNQGVLAGLAGLLLVSIFLAVFYRGLGILSWFSLALFAIIYLGILAALSAAGAFALSLPGVAGIVLSVGLAADTSILMFERLKEEVKAGKTPRTASKSATKHALLTSVDADIVTFVSAIFIAALAIGPVKGFAVTLIIGLCVDLIVGFLFTRPMIMLLSESVMTKMPQLFGLKGGEADA